MTDLLIKLFIRNDENVHIPSVREKHGTLSSVVGILVNLIISITKLVLGLISASVALMADALNNLSDAGSSIVTMVSFKLSAKPADKDHPFGHERIEYIASMIVSFLILVVGFEMLSSSVTAIFKPDETAAPDFSVTSLIIVAISITLKLWLGLFQRRIGKKIDSSVIRASGADSLMDCVSTVAVLISSIIVKLTNFILLDAIVGILVSFLIFYAGIKILNETKNSLIGEAANTEIKEKIEEIVSHYPEIVGTHDMLIHNYGPNRYLVSLHAEVDGKGNIFTLHDVIDNLEKEIDTALNIVCTVHMDPIVTDDELVNEKRRFTTDIVKKTVGDNASIHDFRMVVGETHTNLIFDVMLPFEAKITPNDAVKMICEAVNECCPDHFCVITVDRG
jgi:cation diffusion facilitator family transporter